jgi:integrase
MKMPKLYLRGKVYWYRFTWKDPNGTSQRIRKSTEQTDLDLATAIALDAVNKLREANESRILHRAPTLEDFLPTFEAWIANNADLSRATKKAYRWSVGILKKQDFAKIRMDRITNGEVATADLGENGSSRRMVLKVLRLAYSRASEPGPDRVFWGEIPKFKNPKTEPRSLAMTVEQGQIIASLMTGDARDIFIVLRATGARPSEIMSAKWQYVHFDPTGAPGASYIFNPKGKTRSARRRIPLLRDSEAIMRLRWEEQGSPSDGWCFPNDRKQAGHITNIDAAFTAARNAAGFPKELVLYCARHGAVTDAATVLNQKELMEIFGHSDVRVSMGYQHVDGEELNRRAAGRFSEPIGTGTKSCTVKVQ